MAERRRGPGDAGIADENVDLAVAFVQGETEPGDAVEIGEVERHQRGGAAVLADLVVEFFEATLRARHGDDMGAGLGECKCGGTADAARGAGDDGDTGGEGLGHVITLSRPGLVRTCARVPGSIRRGVYNGGRWLCLIACDHGGAGGYGSRDKPGTKNGGCLNSLPPAVTIAGAAAQPGSGR